MLFCTRLSLTLFGESVRAVFCKSCEEGPLRFAFIGCVIELYVCLLGVLT